MLNWLGVIISCPGKSWIQVRENSLVIRRSDRSTCANQDDHLWDQIKMFSDIVDNDLVHSQLERPPFKIYVTFSGLNANHLSGNGLK